MKKIAILSFNYLIQYSPTVKNMASFFVKRGVNTTIIADEIGIDLEKELPGVKVVRLFSRKSSSLRSSVGSLLLKFPYLGKYILSAINILYGFIGNPRAINRLRDIVNDYDYIFCVEIKSLDILYKAGFPLNKTVFLSLELEQYFWEYNLSYTRSLVESCSFCVIQNPNRAKNFSNFLKTKLNFEYFPVSTPPIKSIKRHRTVTKDITFVYSGTITKWCCLLEFVSIVKKLPRNMGLKVVVLGRPWLPSYVRQIRRIIRNDNRFVMDTSYKTDRQVLKLLQKADVGLAFYKRSNDQKNWENMITSSGKIAFYLWSGLGVLTNLKEEGSQRPPFLYINRISEKEIEKAILTFQRNRKMYRDSSLSLAKRKYNSNIYLEKILRRVLNLGVNNK
jgi:hypothetical protein